MSRKTEENIGILVTQIIDSMDLDQLLDIACEQVENNLLEMDQEEFDEEWKVYNEDT